MPYIKQEFRPQYDAIINALLDKLKENGPPPGDLNYCISRIIWSLFNEDPRYAKGEALRGCLKEVSNEFRRRKLVPLEERKIQENGDLPEA